jgi:hypothetical protein
MTSADPILEPFETNGSLRVDKALANLTAHVQSAEITILFVQFEFPFAMMRPMTNNDDLQR